MNASAASPVCPLCGAPADLSGLAPVVAETVVAAVVREPSPTAGMRQGRGLPRCERVERELERRAEARHAATARALEELIAGGARERDLP